MWGVHLYIFWTLLWVARGAPSTVNVCPEHCECYPLEGRLELEAHCSSQDFLDKIEPKQIALVVSLNLRAQSIKQIDHKLKKLYNLRKLDLSDNAIEDLKKFPNLPKLKDLILKGNYLRHLTAAELPKSIENLDLSSNNITYITDVSRMLPNLKELDLNDNFVSCECDFLKERDFLLQNGVNMVRPTSCFSPSNVKGKSMLAVYCSSAGVMYDELMAGDEPDVGSGDLNSLPTFDDVVDGSSEGNIEDDYIITDNRDVPLSRTRGVLVEGSGNDIAPSRSRIFNEEDEYEEYGSGEITSEATETTVVDLTESNIRACFFNCSTPPPVIFDETNTGSPTDVVNEFHQIIQTLTGQTDPTTVEPTRNEEVTEEMIKPIVSSTNNRAKAVQEEKKAATDIPKELEKQSQEPKQSNTTFIIVAVLLVLMAALVVYAVVKKRSNRKKNRRPNDDEDQKTSAVEMKALISTASTTNEANNLQEKTPLMNGQNGTHGNKEAEEPQMLAETTEFYPKNLESSDDLDDIEVRPKRDDENLLTPETKRVTIQVKELSSPKSPVFVHRVLSDDGRIITTPSLEQRK